MKIKTSELTGHQLGWAVAKCEGWTPYAYPGQQIWLERGRDARGARILKSLHELAYSTNWSQGGPIIEREGITLSWAHPRIMTGRKQAVAQYFEAPHSALDVHRQFGDTPLIAAMRCYVASNLGDEVDVPNELLSKRLGPSKPL